MSKAKKREEFDVNSMGRFFKHWIAHNTQNQNSLDTDMSSLDSIKEFIAIDFKKFSIELRGAILR